jgi:hypothetical protein
MKVSTYIISSIRAYTFRLTTILTITCVSTFKTDIILYITHLTSKNNYTSFLVKFIVIYIL